MRTFLRWWETLGRPERIVAMSLATGGVVAIANSTVWAVAVCYMTRQKALVALRAQREHVAGIGDDVGGVTSGEYGRQAFEEGADVPIPGLRG